MNGRPARGGRREPSPGKASATTPPGDESGARKRTTGGAAATGAAAATGDESGARKRTADGAAVPGAAGLPGRGERQTNSGRIHVVSNPDATGLPGRGERQAALDRLTTELLAARTADGHWTGELSSSALSTATAVAALALVRRSAAGASHGAADDDALAALVRGGVAWLVRTQDPDGGWGDTTDSPGNVSTTALGWAALAVAGTEDPPARAALDRARGRMRRAAGGLGPRALAGTIGRRYGKDRTFSVPILTVLALAGLLGGNERGGGRRDEGDAKDRGGGGRQVRSRGRGHEGRAHPGDGGGRKARGGESGLVGGGWEHVPQLPFELAAVPPAWYRWLRLPVVSYALPALIAIGQARHRQRPTRNPVTRLARRAVRARTLRRLEAIQPRGGGFLEATPLTSFVVMSLVAAGESTHPVARRGVDFLARSARPDGSWPIDTNLATWVTTLSVNALARRPDWRERLAPGERAALSRWLLDQQYRERHVYTDAAPGGWAWTDLPGGVPDADDTPGALLALHALDAGDAEHREAACAGVRWLLDLQNADGGIPTFCRGWGALPFDRSSPDLTAHTLRAWTAWRPALPDALRDRTGRAAARAVRFLERTQGSDGSWIPLWFGNQGAPDDANPVYGTARVLEGLAALADAEASPEIERRAARRLVAAQGDGGGWGGAPGVAPSIEETAATVTALAAFRRLPRAGPVPGLDEAVDNGVRWLIDATGGGRRAEPAPIGLYFAKLWYSEASYPRIFALAALAAAGGLEDAAMLRFGKPRRP